MQVASKRTVFFILLILLWQGIVLLKIWPESMIPSPISVRKSLYDGIMDFTLVYDIVASFRHLFIWLFFSIIIGTALGFLLSKSKPADDTIGSMVLALQSVPSIVWVPLAIIW